MLPRHPHLSNLPSRVMVPVNSLAQTHPVIHLKEQLSQVMECLQLRKVAMEIKPQLSPGIPAMGHLKHRNLWPTPLFMDRPNNHPAQQEAMDSLDTRIHSQQHLGMLNRILVLSELHNLVMVLVLSQGMELEHMVDHKSIREVIVRVQHLTTPMVVGTRSQVILLMAMVPQPLRLSNRVELPSHPKVDLSLSSELVSEHGHFGFVYPMNDDGV